MKKQLKITLTLVFTIIVVTGLIIPEIILGTPASPAIGNWYQQFMPNIGSRSIQDIFFLDSLTGWAVTNATDQSTDTIFVLKTTNSGDNWSIHYRKVQTGGGFSGYFKVYFLNQNTGFSCDVSGVYKTINGGLNWTTLNAPLNAYLDLSVLNTDTIWIVTPDSFAGGVFRTTNGGTSWQQHLNLGTENPERIYMFDSNLGFVSKSTGQILYRTTNSGLNWATLNTAGAFTDMFFANNLTGWKSGAPGGPRFRKTTDGGLNWVDQTMPGGGNITYSQIEKISGLNKDTLWGVGPFLLTSSGFRGMICLTTNGGNNWQFQVPDTAAIQIGKYNFIDFVNKKNGWAYRDSPTGIHTTTGGDPVWLTGLQQISTGVPKNYELYQNYPNPFNPVTKIKYQITKNNSIVKLVVYDIQGRTVTDLVDQKQSAGTYETDFSGKYLASGVYFYKLTVITGKEVFTGTKKMMLVK